MEYNSEVAQLTEIEKRLNLAVLIHIWLRASHYAGLNKSSAILSLTEFLVREMNWDRHNAAKRILDYFKDVGASPDELIDLWKVLKE